MGERTLQRYSNVLYCVENLQIRINPLPGANVEVCEKYKNRPMEIGDGSLQKRSAIQDRYRDKYRRQMNTKWCELFLIRRHRITIMYCACPRSRASLLEGLEKNTCFSSLMKLCIKMIKLKFTLSSP